MRDPDRTSSLPPPQSGTKRSPSSPGESQKGPAQSGGPGPAGPAAKPDPSEVLTDMFVIQTVMSSHVDRYGHFCEPIYV